MKYTLLTITILIHPSVTHGKKSPRNCRKLANFEASQNRLLYIYIFIFYIRNPRICFVMDGWIDWRYSSNRCDDTSIMFG